MNMEIPMYISIFVKKFWGKKYKMQLYLIFGAVDMEVLTETMLKTQM